MKRKDLIKKILEAGAIFVQHGGAHDWYKNPDTKESQPVPRHNEVNDNLAKHILKKLK